MDKKQEETALRLYYEGKTDREIGKEIGLQKRRVCLWRNRKGLAAKNVAGSANICIDCGYPILMCPWLQFGILPSGAVAFPSFIWHYENGERQKWNTFRIVSCPLFCLSRKAVEQPTNRKFRRK